MYLDSLLLKIGKDGVGPAKSDDSEFAEQHCDLGQHMIRSKPHSDNENRRQPRGAPQKCSFNCAANRPVRQLCRIVWGADTARQRYSAKDCGDQNRKRERQAEYIERCEGGDSDDGVASRLHRLSANPQECVENEGHNRSLHAKEHGCGKWKVSV